MKRYKDTRGITLVSLVITIIVMLILAGVSLNMVTGDSSVLGNAMKAADMQSLGMLEEWINQQYLGLVMKGRNEEYKAIDYIINSEDSPLYISPLGYSYMWDTDGKVRYFIDKDKLPDHIKSQLRGGDASEYADYLNLTDVYGVTSNLKVYYYKDGQMTMGVDDDNVKFNLETTSFKGSSSISKLLEKDNVSLKNLVQQNEITIDGTKLTAAEISEILSSSTYFSGLEKVVFKNCNLDNISGIKNFVKLKELQFINSSSADYSALASVTNLTKLVIDTSNDTQVENIFKVMKGKDYPNLTYLAIQNSNSSPNVVTDVDCINDLSNTTKNAITELVLNKLGITNLELNGFNNVGILTVTTCPKLAELKGLKKMNNVTKINLSGNSVIKDNIEEFSKNSKLKTVNAGSSGISSTEFIKNCYELTTVNFSRNQLTDTAGLKDKTKLTYISLEYNKSLGVFENIATCTAVTELYLLETTPVSDEQITILQPIIAQCTKYSLPVGYGILVAQNSQNCVLDGEQIKLGALTSLKNSSVIKYLSLANVKWLDESGNVMDKTNPTNQALITEKINDVLATLTEVEALRLQGESGLTSIEFVKNMTKLKELDLRGTNVTDVSVLDNNCLELTFVIIDNVNTDLTKIQNCINRMYSKTIKGHYYTAMQGNLMLASKGNNTLVKQLANCTELESLNVAAEHYGGYTGVAEMIDLSGLTKLKNVQMGIYSTKWGFKLPSSVRNINSPNLTQDVWDLSQVDNLEKLYSDGVEYTKIFNKLKKGCTIGWIHCRYPEDQILDFSNLDLSRTTKLEIYEYSASGTVKEIKGLVNLQYLTNLVICSKECRKINVIDSAPKLTNASLGENKLESLDFLQNCTSITDLRLGKNQIIDLIHIKEFKKLKYLDLSNNKVQRLSTYTNEAGEVVMYDNLEILKDLNYANGKGGALQQVILTGNNLTDGDYTVSGIKDLTWTGATAW